jgi:predicted nucleic acid-binding protein
MPHNFFIDTNAFLALKDSNDEHHKKAKEIAQHLLEQTRKAGITTDYILDETYTILRERAGHKLAVQFGEEVRLGSRMKIIYLNKELLDEAWHIFKKYKDKDFSFTDCTSFAVMQNHKIAQAFTFDKHFEQAGFEIIKTK